MAAPSPVGSYQHLPPSPSCATRAPHTPGLPQWGAGGGWRGLSAVRLEPGLGGGAPRPTQAGRTSPGLRTGPPAAPGRAPARTRRAAAAGRLRAERKPRAQTGRGGWCERLGPVPARRGWNTMSRAGGRAGSENSLTQQLGKWVCSLTRSTALAACGQRRPDSRRLPRAGGGGGRRAHGRLLGSRPCLPRGTSTWPVCASFCLLAPAFPGSHGPQPSGAGSVHPGGALSSCPPAGVARPAASRFPPKPTTLGGLWRSWCGGCNSSLQMGVEICSRVVGSTGRGC